MLSRYLYLFRHAKSSWADADQDDPERPLAPRGKRAARTMAEHIKSQGLAPALVLCSPAKRARKTLELIVPALGSPQIKIEEAIYGASADELLRRLRLVPGTIPSVMVIGHNPGLQDLAGMLASSSSSRAALEERFPTAALVTLKTAGTWKQLSPGTAELVAYAEPRGIKG